jgi:hypothetical protein
MSGAWKSRHDWIVSECRRLGHGGCHISRREDQAGTHDWLSIRCRRGVCQSGIRIDVKCNNTATSSLVCEASFQLGEVCKCDRLVDGLTVDECLRKWVGNQRECERRVLGPHQLTPAQVSAARAAWAASLRAKQAEAVEKQRSVICVDDDRWDP